MQPRLALAAPWALLASLACGPEADADGGYTLSNTESGLPLAVNRGAGAWTDGERWRASVGLRVGRMEGQGPDIFGDIGAIAADDDGDLYVLEYQAQEIRVFSSDGTHLRTFGRKGEGPGELRGAAGLTFDDQGILWIWDPGNARFARYTPAGDFVDHVPRRVSGVLFPWPGGFDARHGLVDWGLDRPGDAPGVIGSLSLVYPALIDPGTGAVDTLPSLSKDYPLIRNRIRPPFSGLLTTALDRQGFVWFAHTETYTIFKRDLQGDTVLAVTRQDALPQPVTDAEVDSVLERYREYPPALRLESPDEVQPTKPVIQRMLSNGEGQLLVLVDLEGQESGTLVDVFDEESGRYLGSVALPVWLLTNPRPFARGRSLYGVVTGPFDVPEVVRIDFGR